MELGLDDAMEQSVSLIEWPEIASAHLPKDTLYITLEHDTDESRQLTFSSASDRWQPIIEEVAA